MSILRPRTLAEEFADVVAKRGSSNLEELCHAIAVVVVAASSQHAGKSSARMVQLAMVQSIVDKCGEIDRKHRLQ